MKRKNFGIKSIQVLSGCVLCGLSLNVVPAHAAVLSRTDSRFEFDQFSDNALTNNTFSDTDTFSFSNGGPVVTEAIADVLFIDDPAQAGNFVRTEAFVDAPSAFGLAEGEASLVGSFSVGSGESFAFDFLGTMNLVAAVDNPVLETATATSSIIFSVFNTTNTTPVLLDIFELGAGLATGTSNDFLSLNVNEQQNFAIDSSRTFAGLDFEGNTKGIQAQVAGRYSRLFDDETLISLVEVKQSTSTGRSVPDGQAIPEPTTSILIGGLLSSGLLLKKKKPSNT